LGLGRTLGAEAQCSLTKDECSARLISDLGWAWQACEGKGRDNEEATSVLAGVYSDVRGWRCVCCAGVC
jgi:catalase (peroxidase I)